MRPDVLVELKQLRLYGMAGAWSDLVDQGQPLDLSQWLIEHLLQAEHADRAMRSVRHQLTLARFPLHRDLAGFDFTDTPIDRDLIDRLADLSFTEAAHNVVFVGGPGTGKTHLAIALGLAGVTRHNRRVPSDAAAVRRSGWPAAWAAAQHVLEVAYGSCPLILRRVHQAHDRRSALARRRLPANSQFDRPSAIGRIWFSTQLLSIGSRRRR
jgi:DNA replication protein DnaC